VVTDNKETVIIVIFIEMAFGSLIIIFVVKVIVLHPNVLMNVIYGMHRFTLVIVVANNLSYSIYNHFLFRSLTSIGLY